jgi:YD repeat-containing protein
LASIANVASGVAVSTHAYTYDALNRRRQATLEDGSRWRYDYNDRDELISGKRSWLDWTPVAGQQFEYAFDTLGNRTAARSGGDTNGANLRQTDYAANALNQYTSITTPGYKDILGVALATNTVRLTNTVTGTWVEADRKGEYFHGELAIANGSGPLWQTVAVGSGGSVSNGGCVFADNQQALTYDLDGNLSFDGTWAYEWDAENRLRAMTMTNVAGIANANRLRLEFAYGYQSRRVAKTVKVE